MSNKKKKSKKTKDKVNPVDQKLNTIEQAEASEIYALRLHQKTQTDSGHSVTRVPGGFVYEGKTATHKDTVNATFVPFSDEFKA